MRRAPRRWPVHVRAYHSPSVALESVSQRQVYDVNCSPPTTRSLKCRNRSVVMKADRSSRPTTQAGWLLWARQQEVRPRSAKDLLKTLVSYTDIDNSDGTCWPSVNTLADDLGVTMRRVEQLMAILVDDRLVARQQRFDQTGRQMSNAYLLDPEGRVKPVSGRGRSQLQGEGETGFRVRTKPVSGRRVKPASSNRDIGQNQRTEPKTDTGDRRSRSARTGGTSSNSSSPRAKRRSLPTTPGASSLRSQGTPPPAPSSSNGNGTGKKLTAEDLAWVENMKALYPQMFRGTR